MKSMTSDLNPFPAAPLLLACDLAMLRRDLATSRLDRKDADLNRPGHSWIRRGDALGTALVARDKRTLRVDRCAGRCPSTCKAIKLTYLERVLIEGEH